MVQAEFIGWLSLRLIGLTSFSSLTGMQTVWVMGNETEIMTVPEDVVAGYLTYGGNVYGNETYSPSVMHYKSG